MNKFVIGKLVQQSNGYKAFIPSDFPPISNLELPNSIMIKHTEAIRLLGKLDGITELLPDKNLFLLMFIRKDAASSSQIEGTNATMMEIFSVGWISSWRELWKRHLLPLKLALPSLNCAKVI